HLALDEDIEVADIAGDDRHKSESPGRIAPRQPTGHADLPACADARLAFRRWRQRGSGCANHVGPPVQVRLCAVAYQCGGLCRSCQPGICTVAFKAEKTDAIATVARKIRSRLG